MIRGSKKCNIKYASSIEDNITIVLTRRQYTCIDCNHTFKQSNPIIREGKTISIQKDFCILESLRDKNKTYSSVAKEYDVSEPKYSASIDFAEKMADIMTTIDYLQDRVDRVDYNQFTMDIVFDETTNTYKVNCRCGNIVLSPASTFTKEQITPDALQGILYRFSEKVAANSPLSMDEIRKRDISCKLDGQEICKTKFDNVGLLLANGINDALIQNSGTSEPTPGTP